MRLNVAVTTVRIDTAQTVTMSAWKGWNEEKIRRPTSDPPSPLPGQSDFLPAAIGFTAINAPPPCEHPRAAEPEASCDRSSFAARPERPVQGLARSPVADYLGRGVKNSTEAPVKRASGPLHGPGTKKAGGTRKKRAVNSRAQPQAKRRKNNVSYGMPVVKSTSQPTTDKIVTSLDEQKRGRNDVTSAEGIDVSDHGTADTANRFISIFAPPTSMHALQKSSQLTSFESLNPSATHSSMIVYNQTAQQIPSQKRIEQIANTEVSQRFGRVSGNDRNANDYLTADDDEALSEILDLVDRVEAIANRDQGSQSQMQSAAMIIESSERRPTLLLTPDEEFMHLADPDEDNLAECWTTEKPTVIQRSPTPPYRDRKLNMRDVDPHEDYGGAFFSEADQILLAKLNTMSENERKPVVRKAFPASMPDRSSIFGAANATVLRTCFRAGEALNVGAQAVREKRNVILEIYARVTSSHREKSPGSRQHFVFKDLYHDHPPHLEGTYELWQQSELWNRDSRQFLTSRESAALCRAIAIMKRDCTKQTWVLEILSIWEATWEDVGYAAEIYKKD